MTGAPARDNPLGAAHWPVEIRLRSAEKILSVTLDNGEVFDLPAEYLRVESPSAEVQGHGGEEKKIVAGRRHVGILELEPVGNYAVRIKFDDLHDSGLYSWKYLYELGRNFDSRWAAYLAALRRGGASAEP